MIVGGAEAPGANPFDFDVRSVPGGFLVQEWDRTGFDRRASSVVTRRAPTEAEWEQLGYAWTAVKHVKSNAIVLFNAGSAVGVGAGQMSRGAAGQTPWPSPRSRTRGS